MTSVITTQLSHQPVIEINICLCKNDNISSGKNNDRCFSNSRPWLILHSRWHLSGFVQHTELDPDSNLLCQPEVAKISAVFHVYEGLIFFISVCVILVIDPREIVL